MRRGPRLRWPTMLGANRRGIRILILAAALLLSIAVGVGYRVDAADEAEKKEAAESANDAEKKEGGEEAAATAATGAKASPSGANTFNRLLKKPRSSANAKPLEDGIHDPENPGTALLQSPSEAFEGLPKTGDGNRVDWVKALEGKAIAPRTELADPNAEPFTFDLVIVREVKGSMPNVAFPHQQHTEWLDCTNCHDEIFEPQKGANQISMAAILLGQKCGVCHGKVAFPVTDCRRCHSQPKSKEQLKALSNNASAAGAPAKSDGESSGKKEEDSGADRSAAEASGKKQ